MNKLPKEIYVDEDNPTRTYFVDARHAAMADETRVLGVYKLVGKVEVSTETRQEIVVKKSPKKTRTESIPVERNPLLREMVVTTEE